LIGRPATLPQPVVANKIVFYSIVKSRPDSIDLRRPSRPVVNAALLGKCPGLPAFHARRDYGDMVDGSAPQGLVSTDHFKALAAEHLACAGNVLDGDEAIVVDRTLVFERRSDQSEVGVRSQFAQQEFEVVVPESNVRVQALDHIVVDVSDRIVAVAVAAALFRAGAIPCLGSM